MKLVSITRQSVKCDIFMSCSHNLVASVNPCICASHRLTRNVPLYPNATVFTKVFEYSPT